MIALRMLRGGSFNDDAGYLRTTRRGWSKPEDRRWFNGFRLVVKRRKP